MSVRANGMSEAIPSLKGDYSPALAHGASVVVALLAPLLATTYHSPNTFKKSTVILAVAPQSNSPS
jgi:hypothetical protein